MKKLLLTMACAAVFGFAQAAEVTVDFTNPESLGVTKAENGDATVVEGFTCQNIKVTIVQGEGISQGQELRFFTNASGVVDLRTSAKGGAKGHKLTVATVDGQNITSIVFDGRKFNVTANPGTLEGKTWSGDAASVTFTTTGAVNLNNMVVSYGGEADTRKPAGLSFPEEKYTATFGEAFTAPTLTKATTAAVTYSSDAETVATVDPATGAVTLVGEGTARITAKAEANDQYKAGEASYLLTVEDPAIANALYSGLINNGDDWTIDNGTLPEGLTYIWKWDSQYNYMKASAYKGGNLAASATVTSPVIDLTDYKDVTLSFEHVGNFFKGNMQNDVKVLISVDGGEFTNLAVAPWPEADGWKPWVKATADLKAYDGKKIQVRFLYTSTTERAGTWEIKTFLVNGTKTGSSAPLADAGLSFPEGKYTATLGETFTAPTLTKATTAAVTYSSDAETVATVDPATGAVTLVGVGTARITATAEANNEYKAGEASYLLTVKAPVVAPADAVYFSEMGEDFTFETTDEFQAWKHDSKYGLKGSAYKDGINATVSYAISPVIDLTAISDAKFSFKQAFNQYKINNELIEVANLPQYAEIVVREQGATEWTKLATPTLPESFSWNFFDNEEISLAAYADKKIQLGYKYISTTECAGTWEVKEIVVTGTKNTEGVADEIVDENAPAVYYNLQGVRVDNPENGLYIKVQGKKSSKVYVK